MTKYRSVNGTPAKLILNFIKTYQREHGGVSPSLREIAKGAFLSKSTVIDYLNLLESWGIIERERGVARGIHVLADELPEENKLSGRS